MFSTEGCEYLNPENPPTWEMVTQHLPIHQNTVHPVQPAGQAIPGPTSAPRTAKEERPTISSQMSEEQWRFFMDEWNHYKRQTKVKDQELLDELWSCMVEELRQLAFAEGGSSNLHDEETITNKIKSLAYTHQSMLLTSMNNTNSQMKMFILSQPGLEASQHHVALQKKCPGCQQVVNFSEETCYHVVMAGLSDQGTKEKALTQAMMDNIKDLDSLVRWCTAEESGRLGNTIARVGKSSYKLLHGMQSCNNCGCDATVMVLVKQERNSAKLLGKLVLNVVKRNILHQCAKPPISHMLSRLLKHLVIQLPIILCITIVGRRLYQVW